MLLPECWRHVFTFLSPCALLNCASVSQRWCALARDERVWARHARRVREQLGEFRDVGDEAPTWKVFTQALLAFPGWVTINEGYGYREITMRSALVMRSLCDIPRDWSCEILHNDGTQKFCLSLTTDRHRLCGANVFRGLSDHVLTNVGILQVNNRVNPLELRRFHSIVRDSDCQGLREERFWVRLIKYGPA